MPISPITARQSDFASKGEYDTYLLFNELFSCNDSVSIFANVNYIQASRKLNGQVDFIYIDKEVILFIEVKGGAIQFDKHKRKFYKSYGGAEEKDPFKQITDYLYDFRDRKISKRFTGLYLDQKIAFGYCVFLPETIKPASFSKYQKGEGVWTIEYDPEITGDLNDACNSTTFMKFIGRVKKYWLNHPHNKYHNGLTNDELKMLSSYIRDDLKFEIPLPKYFEINDEETRYFTRKQAETVLNLIRHNDSSGFMVTGGPGTGKTLIARELLVRLSIQGKRVLLVCHNKSLADFLRNDIKEENLSLLYNTTVIHLEKLYKDTLERSRIKYDQSIDTWKDLPKLLTCHSNNFSELETYDYLIVDEGQDIFYSENMNAIELFLKDGFISGNFAIFLDKDNQNTYGSFDPNYYEDFRRKFHAVVLPLAENCRNTQGILKTSSLYTGVNESPCMKKASFIVKPLYWNTQKELLVLIENIVNDLLSKNVAKRKITILAEPDLVSLIVGINNETYVTWDDTKEFRFPSDKIMVMTPSTFKGLENNIIIFTGTKRFDQNDVADKATWHVAFTRAKDSLYLLFPNNLKSDLSAKYFKNANF